MVEAAGDLHELLSGKKPGRTSGSTSGNSERSWAWPFSVSRMSVTVMVGWSSRELAGAFSQVEVAGRVESPYAMPFETRWPIHVCRGPKVPLIVDDDARDGF